MTFSTAPTDQAREEAADWFARLKKLDVPGDDLKAFKVWRRTPGHKEAYDEVVQFWRRSETFRTDPSIQEALAGARTRAGASPAPRVGPAGRRPIIGIGLAIAVIAVAGVGTFRLLAPAEYTTRVGEQRFVRLADGSTLKLDTGSKVVVRYASDRRDIQLVRGQVLFDVAHDAARPFVVRAGDTSVTALGTRFDVRRDPVGVQVTLVRGAVEVKDHKDGATRAWRLAPGQAISTHAPAPGPRPVDVAVATSWTSGRLVFRAAPLATAVAEVNRYNHDQVVLDGPGVADKTISGAFDAGDTETFVDSVAQLHDLAVARPEKGVIRLSQARQDDARP